uniref:Uncharacterized protein n=1 Tax=Arion vulgaris TaxID=1028688 RepID=A0A0B6YD18_9EUPU
MQQSELSSCHCFYQLQSRVSKDTPLRDYYMNNKNTTDCVIETSCDVMIFVMMI